MRFPIRIDPWWQPLLALFGATRSRSYVEMENDRLAVRFGLFRYRVDRGRVADAQQVKGRWWIGIGCHTDILRWLAINGSLNGMVELRIQPAQWLWLLFIPVHCSQLYVSLEDPDAFLRALGK